MLTQAEVKKIIDQINESFKEDRKRIATLEAKVAALETPKTTKKAPTEEK